MSKTFKDQQVREDRSHLRGFASELIPEEDKQRFRAAGGRERARRKSGHQWTTIEARLHGMRGYLQQINEGVVFGYRPVRRVPLIEPEPVVDTPTWEGEKDEDESLVE